MINTGTIIYDKLKDLVDNRVYPLVAELTTKKPFIVYQTRQTPPVYTKDGICEWVYTMNISCIDDYYDNCFQLSSDVVDRLQDINYDINIENISEDYSNDSYVRDIEITIKI